MASTDSYATRKWWKEAVVYQIYPASFLSTGSGSKPGYGDIKGISSKLDYLKHLGVDVVWVSPIYKSPQVDMGYDISDYKDIDPIYGSLSDVDELISGLKARGMRLVMDLVVNHTSDQHAWFLDSRSSKQSSKRDWYIWQPAKYSSSGERQPPNNWCQILGTANSAWTWDETSQEYFLSLFTPEQPDLNWRNPAVRAAVHDVLRFWLDRGASGFRMDVINLISKVSGYPDAEITVPGAKYQPGHKFFANGPHMHEYLRDLHDQVLNKYDTITVGEMPFVSDDDEILQTVGAKAGELNMIFIFDLVDIDNTNIRLGISSWPVSKLRDIVTRWQKTMIARDGWNSVFIENHDNPRSVTRYVDDSDEFRDRGAKLLALMQTTLGGTVYVYQGEELGQRDVPLEWDVAEYKDIESINFWKKALMDADAARSAEEKEAVLVDAKKVLQRKARDHARTPVQWTGESPNAGFCDKDTKSWMRVNDDFPTVNAAAQAKFAEADQLSVLQFWQRGLRARKENADVFVYGGFEQLDDTHASVFAYERRSQKGEAFVVVLNFSGDEVEWAVPEKTKVKKWVAGTYAASAPEIGMSGKIKLRAWEGVLGMAE